MRPTSLEWAIFWVCMAVLGSPYLLALALKVAVWIRAWRERRG